jgi:hypothetical protein
MLTPAQKGFMVLTQMLTGHHKYTKTIKEEWEEPLYVKDLPIAANPESTIQFIGSEGITASIGAWIIFVATVLSRYLYTTNPINKLRKILVDASDDRREQHMVYFSIIFDDDEEVMVGGCTDFSGEGGVGTRDVDLFLSFLETIYGIPVTEEHYQGVYENVTRILIDAEDEQRDNNG